MHPDHCDMTAPKRFDRDLLDTIIKDVRAEFVEATNRFGSFNSAHEGYAVMLEEMDELWTAIKDKNCNHYDQRSEAIQVAAMALRFIHDCCGQ